MEYRATSTGMGWFSMMRGWWPTLVVGGWDVGGSVGVGGVGGSGGAVGGRVGGARPGRKVLSLVSSMLVGGSHIDHVDLLRAGSTGRVLPSQGDGPLDCGYVSALFHVGSCPPVG